VPLLLRFQSLCYVSDQIVWVLDADRQPDRRVENSEFLLDVGRHAGMGYARRQACEGLSSTKAHRQLQDLQRVKKLECSRLAADNIERECGARTDALSPKLVQRPPTIAALGSTS
jgi:hypothetical protein